ncbi:TPR-like protein [Thozetella sp. PMI_491]|nr:TPR-like protein [Thozetella sp. PMI_491]
MEPRKMSISKGFLRRVLSKGKEKQPVASEHAASGASSNPSTTCPTSATNEGEQQSPTDHDETLLPSIPSDDPAPGLTNTTPRVQAGPSAQGASLSVENFGLFEFPERESLAGQALPSPLHNARYVDIIAVHGLGGHWQLTWTGEDGAIWLRDRLPGILAESNIVARVRSFGYDSATVFSHSITDLQTAAKTLLVRLRGFRKTQQQRTYPIIFVCHSLGGLVVKEALVQAWNRSSYNQDILDMAKACLFLGVPHRGSGLADWATVPISFLKTLSMGFTGNSNFVGILKSSSKDWVRLSDNFVERAEKLYFRSFFETEKYGNLIVVDEGSAAMHIRTEQVIPLDGSNHRNICKFRANEDQRFSPVGDAAIELAELILPSTEEVQSQTMGMRCLELLPIATNTFFGREPELSVMIDVLTPQTKGSGQKRMVLYGMPGTGKTQLALQYVERNRNSFTSIFWITASSPEATSTSFSEAAALISSVWPMDLPNPYTGQDDRQRVVSRLRSTLHRDWLLIIDSADDIHGQDFRQFVPDCNYGSILVTSTRREAIELFGMESMEISSLDPKNGQQLLLARLQNTKIPMSSALSGSRDGMQSTGYSHTTLTMPDENAARAIAKELDHLPLAIEHAAALVRLNRFTLDTFLLGYRQHYHRLANEKLPRGLLTYEKSLCLFTLIEMLHSTIQEESPEAAALLTLLAFLGPWRFPLDMFRPSFHSDHYLILDAVVMRLDNLHLKAILTDDIALSLALSHLSDACMVKSTSNRASPESVSAHNIICQWVFETTAEKGQWALAAALTLSTFSLTFQEKILFPRLTSQEATYYQLAPLIRCASLVRDYTNLDELAALEGHYTLLYGDLESSLAFSSLQASQPNAARTHFQQAVECQQLQQGDMWPSGEAALRLLYGLAITYHKGRDTEKAAEALESVLELALQTFDEFDDRTVEINARFKAVADLAGLNLRHHKAVLLASTVENNVQPRLKPQDQFDEAEAPAVTARSDYPGQDVSGNEHPHALTTMYKLASGLNSQGKYEEAEPIYRKTLEFHRHVLSDKHPYTLITMNNFAYCLDKQGKYEEAERMYHKTLELWRQIPSDEYRHSLATMYNLASSLSSRGKYEEAEPIYRKTLELQRQVRGNEHLQTLNTIVNLAYCLDKQGKYEEAEPMFRKTLEHQRQVLGDKHLHTLNTMANLAYCLDNKGEYEEAEPLHRKTLELHRQVLGDKHPYTLITMNNLAYCLNKLGKYKEAEPIYRKIRELQRQVPRA